MQHQVLLGLAAAAEHPLIDIDFTAFVQFGIFAVTLVVASTLVFRPYLRMRDARSAGIEGKREESARLTADSEASLADYETKVAAARDRALDERRKIRTEAAVAHRETTDKAKAQAIAAVNTARQTLESQAEAARKELLPRAD